MIKKIFAVSEKLFSCANSNALYNVYVNNYVLEKKIYVILFAHSFR